MLRRWQRFEIGAIESVINVIFIKQQCPHDQWLWLLMSIQNGGCTFYPLTENGTELGRKDIGEYDQRWE